MSRNRPAYIVGLFAVFLLLGWIALQLLETEKPAFSRKPVNSSHPNQDSPTDVGKLAAAMDALKSGIEGKDAQRLFENLRDYLTGLPKTEAVREIIAFLDSGDDASTGLEFRLGKGGSLVSWPSVRVALLDWLGHIDSETGAKYAEKVLKKQTHPDEWALAFRNYGRVNETDEGRAFLVSKVTEMIDHTDWRSNPSVGFLESFDVLVHARSTKSTPKLSSLAADTRSESRALAHAAFLTLDRLTLVETESQLRELGKDPDLTKVRGGMVSNLYARADIRNPEERQLLEGYLLSPERTQKELQSFAGVYPNNNQMISNNLLTQTVTPKNSELAAHDREALGIVEGWINDPKFRSILPHLQTMRRRLSHFVEQTQTY